MSQPYCYAASPIYLRTTLVAHTNETYVPSTTVPAATPLPAGWTVLQSTSLPPRWKPCMGCGGTGGSMQPVDWAVRPQWITCIHCGGGCGMFLPG